MSSHLNPHEHSEHTSTGQAVFGMKRAAEVAGVSVSTIRRSRSRLEECGAEISPDGWKVPMSALVASGLMKPTTPADDHLKTEKDPQNATQGHSEVRELERQVMELRHRAELAEERQRSAEEQARLARELAANLKEALAVERRMLLPPQDNVQEQVEKEDTGSRSTEVGQREYKRVPKSKRGWFKIF